MKVILHVGLGFLALFLVIVVLQRCQPFEYLQKTPIINFGVAP